MVATAVQPHQHRGGIAFARTAVQTHPHARRHGHHLYILPGAEVTEKSHDESLGSQPRAQSVPPRQDTRERPERGVDVAQTRTDGRSETGRTLPVRHRRNH
jgi:hypothetical protein